LEKFVIEVLERTGGELTAGELGRRVSAAVERETGADITLSGHMVGYFLESRSVDEVEVVDGKNRKLYRSKKGDVQVKERRFFDP